MQFNSVSCRVQNFKNEISNFQFYHYWFTLFLINFFKNIAILENRFSNSII